MLALSVVIPCLNEEHYIGKLLHCLAVQTYQNFEVIVVDGQSEDKTIDVIHEVFSSFPEFAKRVHIIVADKRGVSYQRNLGAKEAKSERLLFLDADVQVKSTFLHSTLTELNKKDLDLATVRFEPLSSRVDDKIMFSIANAYVSILQYMEPVSLGWCIFSTKRIHNHIHGFDEKLRFGEDYEYVQRAAKCGAKLKVLPRGRVYFSVRRLSDEGRLTYVKKSIMSEIYRFLHGKVDKELFPYEFGKFKEDIEALKLDQDKDQKVVWKKLIEALKITDKPY